MEGGPESENKNPNPQRSVSSEIQRGLAMQESVERSSQIEDGGGTRAPSQEQGAVPARMTASARTAEIGGSSQGDHSGGRSKKVTRTGSLSMSFLSSLVSAFTDQQKKIIRDSGFGFVLLLRDMKAHLKVGSWGLINIDVPKSELNLDNGQAADISKKDLQIVLGLRTGKPLPDPILSRKQRADRCRLERQFPDRKTGCLNLETAKKCLLDLKGKESMDEEESKNFLAAIVVVAVVDVLAPKKIKSKLDAQLAAAIQDKDGPAVYDWADFAMKSLLDAAASFKRNMLRIDAPMRSGDITTRRFAKSVYVPGCTLFIAVSTKNTHKVSLDYTKSPLNNTRQIM